MDPFAILATCAALSGAAPQPETPISPADCEAAAADYQANLQSVELSSEDRDAIARVAFADAANQGDSGLAGVVYTIIKMLRVNSSPSTVPVAGISSRLCPRPSGPASIPSSTEKQGAGSVYLFLRQSLSDASCYAVTILSTIDGLLSRFRFVVLG